MRQQNKKIPKSEPEEDRVGKTEQCSESGTDQRKSFARRCMQAVGTPKEWASALSVSTEYVRMMIRGERAIPERFILNIARAHKVFSRRLRAFDDWADRVIEEQYGSADPSNF